MISNKNKKKKHIIFNYLSPKNEMLARILSQMNFNIFYLKLKNYNKETGFIEKKVNSVNELGEREIKTEKHKTRISNYGFGCKIKKHPFISGLILFDIIL